MSQGRIIKSNRVRVGPSGGRPTPRGAPDFRDDDGIAVNLHRQGDLLHALEIQCACGRHKTMDCIYETPSGHEPPGKTKPA